MEKTRQLNGKGEMDYDYANDILFFKVKDREYNKSLEFENFVIDIDSENFVTGIQIFEASKFLQTDRISLRNVPKWTFKVFIEEGKIEIRLNYQTQIRNQIIEKTQS